MKYYANSKLNKIRLALLNGEKLSSLDAVERFRTTRLAAYVHTLRKTGYKIITIMKRFRTDEGEFLRYAEYWIPPSWRENQ